MSWKARSTSVISSRPGQRRVERLALGEPSGVVAQDGQPLDDPLEEQEGQDRASRPRSPRRRRRASRPAAPRTSGGSPSAGGPGPPPRRGPRRWSPRTASRSWEPRSSPAIARSRSPERTSRSSSATQPRKASNRPASSAIRGVCRSLSETSSRRSSSCAGTPAGRPRTARDWPGRRRRSGRADPRVALDEAAVQLLDLGDDVLGVDGPFLGAVVIGLGLHQDGDEDRLDQQGDRDQGQALLEDRELCASC